MADNAQRQREHRSGFCSIHTKWGMWPVMGSKMLHFEKEFSFLEDRTLSQYECPTKFLPETLLFNLFSSFTTLTIGGIKVTLIVSTKDVKGEIHSPPTYFPWLYVVISCSRRIFSSGRRITNCKKPPQTLFSLVLQKSIQWSALGGPDAAKHFCVLIRLPNTSYCLKEFR